MLGDLRWIERTQQSGQTLACRDGLCAKLLMQILLFHAHRLSVGNVRP